MSNILIINGAKKFAHSNGQLNDTLTEVADGYLRDAGHDVKVVRAESDYDIKEEVQNFLWADVVIWQMPGWWMGAPWTVKKYIDDVFTEGHGALYASDGRTRSDASKKYGFRRPDSGEKIYAVPDLERADGSVHRERPVLPRRWRRRRVPAIS
ncbi:Modulator of drug activity B [Klebsiella michiganensis]|nr:Modulator of drug activity B [Klebsiella michiganensis]